MTAILLIDLATFVVAVATLFAVAVPQQGVTAAATRAGASLWQDFSAGLSYIRLRPGLIGLLVFYRLINFIAALTFYATLPALILGRSGGDEFALAVVQSTLGAQRWWAVCSSACGAHAPTLGGCRHLLSALRAADG